MTWVAAGVDFVGNIHLPHIDFATIHCYPGDLLHALITKQIGVLSASAVQWSVLCICIGELGTALQVCLSASDLLGRTWQAASDCISRYLRWQVSPSCS